VGRDGGGRGKKEGGEIGVGGGGTEIVKGKWHNVGRMGKKLK